MPHLIWGVIVAILLFGSDVKVGIEARKQRIERTFQDIQRAAPKPVVPKLPATRQANNDATDSIWKLFGKNSTGTAFVIGRTTDGRILLVTAEHCVRDGNTGYVLGGGKFGEHIKFENVSVLGRDAQNDVALLQAPSLTPYRPITVSQWRAGVEGDSVEMAGYGGGVWSHHHAVLKRTQRINPIGSGKTGLMPENWITDEIAVPGHSGAPVFDKEDRLVGVMSASGGGISAIVHARYVRWLLEEVGEETIIDRRVPVDEARNPS